MLELLEAIRNLQNSDVKNIIDERLQEFLNTKSQSIEEIFKELCFCVMTANCSAEKCIEIHEGVRDGFLDLSEVELSNKFKTLGYRFPNVRANYIIKARNIIRELENILKSNNNDNIESDLRDWLVANVKGLGYKEASHFLRNIGYKNLAIIDFHIIDVLEKHNLIQRPKTLTKKKYMEIEILLKQVASKVNTNLAELDLYLWFMETGKVLK